MLPNLDDVLNAIQHTGDSAAGPDGIPFAAYRNLHDVVSPVLLGVFSALAKGEHPPKGFNLGLLLLLPKNDSGLIQDTRPLGINNCDNRIVAKVMNCVLHPAIGSLIGPEQQGFILQRLIEKHLLE